MNSNSVSLRSGFRAFRVLVLITASLMLIGGGALARAGDPAVPSGGRARSAPGRIYDAIRPELTRNDRIVVKFREGTGIRLRGGRFVSLDPGVDLSPLLVWSAANPSVGISRRFHRSEQDLDQARLSGNRNAPQPLADLNLYYELRLPTTLPATRALDEIRALPEVETAFADPVPEPAAGPAAAGPEPASPDYTAQQGYVMASPSGVNAQAVWAYAGGRGATVKLIDIEGAWLWTHEDLKAPFYTAGTPFTDASWRNHGTAVMGEMIGNNNTFGVTGIASDLQVGGISIQDVNVADAIDMASAHLASGDCFLIELHTPGPNSNGTGQFGYVPMEFYQDVFDAIQTATSNGRICIEAGGNGEQNLDDPIYQGIFDRTLRNSGAIMVGAGTPTGLDAEWFTNYGTRMDLNGWGSYVVTTGYGDLQGGAETQWYTAGFSGTSSASPIVAGSAASLQGMCKANWGISLNGALASQILYQTGTPWNGTKRIGRRPNLVAARALMLQGVGRITGTVRDAASHAPIAGAEVILTQTDARALTDGSGGYVLPVLTGSYTVQVAEFFHATDQQTVNVGAGQSVPHDVNLQLKPQGGMAGTVMTQQGVPLAGARVRILDTPIAPASSGMGGVYTIGGIPAAPGYTAVFGLVPSRGATFRGFEVQAGRMTPVNALLVDAQTFESGNGSFTGASPWAWGTPSGPGPGGAFSGTKLWATNLTGNYPDNASAALTSSVYNFSGATRLALSFTQWYDTEAGYDGGNVQVKVGADWVVVDPVGGYPYQWLPGLAGQKGYGGNSGGWQPAVFDLTPYIGSAVQIRFQFGSDQGVNAPGWYVDDVAFDTGAVPVSVPAGPPEVQVAARPSPFRTSAGITFGLPAPGPVFLAIYDPSGRRVRTLLDGPLAAGAHEARWDGTDVAGRAVPAGTYFYRLSVNGRLVATRPLIRLR